MPSEMVFLLAGGEGTRLYPLTKNCAKPAVPFGGMWRLIDFTLSNCLHSGLRRICILTQHKSESLTRHVTRAWRSFGSALGESIDLLPSSRKSSSLSLPARFPSSLQGDSAAQREQLYRGTADAVFQNLDMVLREGARDVLILSGDHVYAMDYRPFLAFHRDRDADLTIAGCPVPAGEAFRFGILEAGADGRIRSFIEKPRKRSLLAPAEDGTVMASMGVYIFKTRTLLREGQERTPSARALDFGADLIPSLIGRERVFVYPYKNGPLGHTSYWRDVGTLDSYYDGHMELLGAAPAFDLGNQAWPILHAPEQTGPSVFGGGAGHGARNSIVAGGCRIDGKVFDSVIAPQVTVEAGACVFRSILLPGVHVEAGARVRAAILDKRVRVYRGTILDAAASPIPCTYGGKVTLTPRGIAVVGEGEIVDSAVDGPAPDGMVGERVLLDHEVVGGVAVPSERNQLSGAPTHVTVR